MGIPVMESVMLPDATSKVSMPSVFKVFRCFGLVCIKKVHGRYNECIMSSRRGYFLVGFTQKIIHKKYSLINIIIFNPNPFKTKGFERV